MHHTHTHAHTHYITLLAGMDQHVCIEATLPGEGCATSLTLKLLFTIVHQHVCVEAAAPCEPLTTLVTLKLLLTSVC